MNLTAFKSKQKGVTLIIGLIFLFVMSIVGLNSIQKVTLQERITGNTIDNNRAFQAAEIALAAAENEIEGAFNEASYRVRDLVTNSTWQLLTDTELLDVSNWDCTNASLLGGSEANQKKMCTIQLSFQDSSIVNPPWVKYEKTGTNEYRITVRVQGNGRSQVMLQSVYEYN